MGCYGTTVDANDDNQNKRSSTFLLLWKNNDHKFIMWMIRSNIFIVVEFQILTLHYNNGRQENTLGLLEII